MEVELTVADHYAMQTHVVVCRLPAVLGRNEKADVCLKDPWASHEHCVLSELNGAVVVRDLSSKNGVFLHGHRVSESHVLPGDRFTIGQTEITVHYQRRLPAASETPPDGMSEANALPLGPSKVEPETVDLLYGVVPDAPPPPTQQDDDPNQEKT